MKLNSASKFIALFLLTIFLFSSCASRYHMIYPRGVQYIANSSTSDVSISYKYHVLSEHENMKYSKKENKRDVRLIAVEVTNNKSHSIIFDEDIRIYVGPNQVQLMEPESIYRKLKQPVPIYLLYSLLWVFITNCEGNNCTTTPIPLGLGIGIGNMVVAGKANKDFMFELQASNMIGKEIRPGETVYGLIGIENIGYNPLEFTYTGK